MWSEMNYELYVSRQVALYSVRLTPAGTLLCSVDIIGL